MLDIWLGFVKPLIRASNKLQLNETLLKKATSASEEIYSFAVYPNYFYRRYSTVYPNYFYRRRSYANAQQIRKVCQNQPIIQDQIMQSNSYSLIRSFIHSGYSASSSSLLLRFAPHKVRIPCPSFTPKRKRNGNLTLSKAPLKIQAHQGTSLFTIAATNQRGFQKVVPGKLRSDFQMVRGDRVYSC